MHKRYCGGIQYGKRPDFSEGEITIGKRGGGLLDRYLTYVIILSFVVDFLLLCGTNRMCGCINTWKRLVFAAVLGGLYSGSCLLPGAGSWGNWVGRIASIIIKAIIAFGWNRSGLRRSGVFLMLNMSLGGLLAAAGNDSAEIVIGALVLILMVCRLSFSGGIIQKKIHYVKVVDHGSVYTLKALVDTGNLLTDPITGEPVMIMGLSMSIRITGFSKEQLVDPLDTMCHAQGSGLRIIPYSTIGETGKLLLAVRLKEVWISGRKRSLLAALAPVDMDGYDALLGGAEFE